MSVKISELPVLSPGDVAAGDVVAIVDASEGVTKQVDLSGVVAEAVGELSPPALISGNTTTRQTVLSGPVDANGRADFLDAGTGLQVVTTGLDVDPLQITFGDGFTDGEQRNFGVSIDSALTWNSLPNGEDEVFLFVRVLPDGTVETFHSLLAPVYAQARPSAPATGQTFYPTDHRHRMEVWDGAEWNRDNLLICVGECATSAGAVVDVRSHAYGGRAVVRAQIPSSSSNVFADHNIGTRQVSFDSKAIFTSNAGAWVTGDIVYMLDTLGASSSTSQWTLEINRNSIRHRWRSSAPTSCDSAGNSANLAGNADLLLEMKRAF